MHRTQSWDIGVVLEGRVVLGLDGGEEKVIGAGEVVVQRGTNHVSLLLSASFVEGLGERLVPVVLMESVLADLYGDIGLEEHL